MGVSGLSSKQPHTNLNNHEISNFFMESGKLSTFPKGASIYSPGEISERIYYLNHGEIKVSRSTNDGKEIILDILGPGNIFGEVEAFCGKEIRSNIIAKKDSILHFVSLKVFEDKLKRDSRLMSWFLRKISQKQLSTENLLENLLFKSANAKVAHLLLELAETHGIDNDRGVLINYLITHQEIGNTIATTRETVSYAFMEFRQLGLIDTIKRRTVILNKEALEEVAAE